MAALVRASIGFLLLTSLVGGVVGQLGVHAHAFGEIDLVAHSLVAIEHAPSPRAAAHFDRAVEVRHPVCADCLLASLRTDVAAEPPSAPALTAVSVGGGARPVAAPVLLADGRAPARAPPAA